MNRPRYSFVIPVYNEAETLAELRARLRAVLERLDGVAEVILVDDGSTDGSAGLLADFNREDERFKVIRFSRNFGHQVAITAGLDFASGDAVVIMDGDLQDPPELALELVERWRDGYEIVYAVREDRIVESRPRRWAISLFYRVLARLAAIEIPVDAGDFRLVDRRALEEFKRLRESNRYVRGLFAWIGFRQVGVPYKRDPRFAGKTKYPFRKLVKLALAGVTGFSEVPLRLALGLGFVFSIAAFILGIVAIALRIADIGVVPGWTSVVVVTTFVGGVQLIVIGMMGLYVGRIYEEVRGRPLYVVRDATGFDPEVAGALQASVALGRRGN